MEAMPKVASRTLIVEKNPTGHRLYYARILANAAASRGQVVTLVLSKDAMRASEIPIHLGGLDERVERVYHSDLTYGGIGKLTHELQPDLTVIPDGDAIAIEVGRRGRWSGRGALSILVMRESAQPSRVPGLVGAKTHLKHMLLVRARNVPGVRVTILKGALWSGRSKFPIARDPVTLETTPTSIQAIRSCWGLTDDVYWFGVLGAISERKNLRLVAEALSGLNNPGLGLLIAGVCDASAIRDAQAALDSLRRTGASVILVNRLLEDWELDSAVAAIDSVVLAHSNEGPSGLFGKAAAAGTRIVAAGARSLKLDSSATKSLATWSPLDARALTGALRHAASQRRGGGHPGLGSDDFVRALL